MSKYRIISNGYEYMIEEFTDSFFSKTKKWKAYQEYNYGFGGDCYKVEYKTNSKEAAEKKINELEIYDKIKSSKWSVVE